MSLTLPKLNSCRSQKRESTGSSIEAVSVGSSAHFDTDIHTVRFDIPVSPVPRTRTSFRLAHPPPRNKSIQRFNIRPRLLLQIHQLAEQSRSFPALDVLPSTIFAPKLASRFPRVFKGRDGLGANDLVVVSSDSYERPVVDDKSSASEDESWESREVVATICQMRKQDGGLWGKAEICLNHGPSWEATPLVNGSYELTSIDDTGKVMIVRWVLRSRNQRTSSLSQATSNQAEDKRFTFSVINPGSRRHPVIASLTRTGFEIQDRYRGLPSTPTPTSPSCAPSHLSSKRQSSDLSDQDFEDHSMIETDQHLRSLIVVSGVWVVFREGWSRNFSYDDAMSASTFRQSFPNQRTRTVSRTNTMPVFEQRNEVSPKLPASVSSASMNGAPPHSRSEIPMRRSHSAGAAYLERANRRNVSATKRSSHPKTVDEAANSDDNEDRVARKLGEPSRNPSRLCPKYNPRRRTDNSCHKTEKRDSDSPKKSPQREDSTSRDEKTISTATTLRGIGDSHEHPPVKAGKEVDTGRIEHDSNKGGRSPSVPKESTQPEDQQRKKHKGWSGLRHLAHVISCR